MKGMILSDFVVAKSYLLQQSVLGLIVALLVTFGMGNLSGFIPIFVCTGSLSIVFTLAALDESNSWERYRLTLPLHRSQIIKGRYLSALFFSLAFILVGLIVFFIVAFFIQSFGSSLPLKESLIQEAHDLSFPTLLAIPLITFFISLFCAALMFPLTARFGATKAIRFIPLVTIMIAVAALFVLDNAQLPFITTLSEAITQGLNTPQGTALIALIALAVTLAIYALSALLATKLYARREF